MISRFQSQHFAKWVLSFWVLPHWRALSLGFALILLNRLCGLDVPASMKIFIDQILSGQHREWLLPFAGGLVAVTALQGITSVLMNRVLTAYSVIVANDLRKRVQQHICRLPLHYYDHNKTGALVSRVMFDVEALRTVLGSPIITCLSSLVTAVGALILIIRLSPLLTAVSFGFAAMTMVILRFTSTRTQAAFQERAILQSELSGYLTEMTGGIRVIKAYRAEDRQDALFSGLADRLRDASLRAISAISRGSAFTTVLVGLGSGLLLFLGTRQVWSGRMTLGSYMTFTLLVSIVVSPVTQLIGMVPQLLESRTGLQRIREILGTESEFNDSRGMIRVGHIKGEVEFSNVSFSYDGTTEVLHDISFSSPGGSVTALVGPSGAGKSTIINLLAGFYSPGSGEILIDGLSLKKICLQSYREHLAVVLQETFLFDGSIRDNVKFANPDASEEEMLYACSVARVDEFVSRFKEGYSTLVGERGIRLSGGQKQRISIARALLADPQILILDEATSHLDDESERFIQAALKEVIANRTTFIIAHRPSTIALADRVLVIEDGCLTKVRERSRSSLDRTEMIAARS